MNAQQYARAIHSLNPKSDRTTVEDTIFMNTNIYSIMVESTNKKIVNTAHKYADYKVIATHDNGLVSWFGTEKNVHEWYELEKSVAIGWNTNSGRNFSFPVKKN